MHKIESTNDDTCLYTYIYIYGYGWNISCFYTVIYTYFLLIFVAPLAVQDLAADHDLQVSPPVACRPSKL